MVAGSKIKIQPACVGYSLMGRFRKYYGSIKIFQFILIIILIVLFLLYEIQQLISNIESWMECMTFHVQLLNCYTMFWYGGNIGLSPG